MDEGLDLTPFKPIAHRTMLAVSNCFVRKALEDAAWRTDHVKQAAGKVDCELDRAEAELLLLESKLGLR